MPTDMSEYQRGLTSPASDAKAVTPSSSALPDGSCRALYVGTAGDVEVTTVDGTTITFSDVTSGVLPISVSHVLASSTTATNIIALY